MNAYPTIQPVGNRFIRFEKYDKINRRERIYPFRKKTTKLTVGNGFIRSAPK